MKDRLSVDKSFVVPEDSVVTLLDEKKLLRLDKSNADRMELFLFAMALGYAQGVRTPSKASHGFILETSATSYKGGSGISQIYSVFINELIQNAEEDKIGDKDYAYRIAEEYANTGFLTIKKWINGKEDPEGLMWSLIAEMDEKLESIFGE